MSEMPNQKSIFGLVLLLLLLGGQSGGLTGTGSPGGPGGLSRLLGVGSSGGIAGLGSLSALGKKLQLENFARDMHRVVDMMDQVENLKQVAGMSQLASVLTDPQSRGQSPSGSGSHVSGAANSVSNAFADSLSSLSSQDLSQLMEMAGPLMNLLGGQNNGYKK